MREESYCSLTRDKTQIISTKIRFIALPGRFFFDPACWIAAYNIKLLRHLTMKTRNYDSDITGDLFCDALRTHVSLEWSSLRGLMWNILVIVKLLSTTEERIIRFLFRVAILYISSLRSCALLLQ
jgi:hypothetical protein